VPFTKLALEGMREAHFESKPDQKEILHEMESRSVNHLFAQRYFSMTPSLLGKRPVKLGAAGRVRGERRLRSEAGGERSERPAGGHANVA
jgi:hypothetical protein